MRCSGQGTKKMKKKQKNHKIFKITLTKSATIEGYEKMLQDHIRAWWLPKGDHWEKLP